MTRLVELTIENFRGASSPLVIPFDARKAIAVIFGENGTGKTTIVDALDLIGNESVGSIREKSSTSVVSHSPTIGRKAQDIRISARSGTSTWTGVLKTNKAIVNPRPSPRIRILRRTNLQRFIEAKPADRYQELRHLIAVDRVEKSERALTDAANQAASSADEFARDRAGALNMLEEIWSAEGSPGADAVSWAGSQTVRDHLEIAQQEALVKNSQRAVQALLDARIDYEHASTLRDRAAIQLRSVLDEIARASGTNADQSIELCRVLERVQHLFSAHERWYACPVCVQPIDQDDLAALVGRRIADLQVYQGLDQRRSASQRAYDLASDALQASDVKLVESVRDVIDIATGKRPDCSPITLADDHLDAFKDDDSASALRLAAEAERLLVRVSRERDELAHMRGRLTALTKSLESIRAAEGQTVRAVRMQAALKKALGIVRMERHQYSQRLLKDVAGETNRLYELIHPGEGLAISRLELDPKQRASLHQSVQFAGYDDVPPQAYFSEAHLDTLGFCFWLAVAKRDALTGQPLAIVIDDVFTSVDAQHLSRITDLIVDESIHFSQTIMTTHHLTIREKFRNSHGAGGVTQVLDLHGDWDVQRGIALTRAPLAIEELRLLMTVQPYDRQAAASKAGIVLEELLDALTLQYQCKLPRKPTNDYTLNDLLDGCADIMKKLRVQGADGEPERVPGSWIAKLRLHNLVRNQVGAHYNIKGHDISNADVKDFVALTIALAESLTCHACGRMPHKGDGTQYRCSCLPGKRTTMTPRVME